MATGTVKWFNDSKGFGFQKVLALSHRKMETMSLFTIPQSNLKVLKAFQKETR